MTLPPEQAEIRDLILASDGDDARITAAVAEIGTDRAAAVLVDELVSRADLTEITGLATTPVAFDIALEHDGRVVHRHVRADGDAEHAPGPAADPAATVEGRLVDFVRAVFGPANALCDRTPRIRWHLLDDPTLSFSDTARLALTAGKRLLQGLSQQPVDLAELSLRTGSDKWGLHYYTPHYARHFEPLRDRPLTILELGIGGYANPAKGGGSLRIWKRLFRRAMIFGVDIYDKSPLREGRIHTVQGDQSDPDFLTSLAERIGPIDIVIDDGSHRCADVISAFHALYPHVVPGGLYVIEDLQTSYWPGYGGSAERLDDPATSMGFLKRLLDGLHHRECELPDGHVPDVAARTLVGAHFYHNLAFLEKADNAEPSLPSWIPRRPLSEAEMSAVAAQTATDEPA